MSITGPADGPPYKVGVAISDVVAGLFAANAIQAALLYRQHSGRGQYIDISLLDTQIAALVNINSNYLISRQPAQRYGNAHPNIVPYETFEAQDGMFILAVGNDRQFSALCNLLGKPDWASDERFATNPARVHNRVIIINLLQPILKQKPVSTWIELLLEAGIPAAPINEISDVFDDPQVQSRDLLQQVTLSTGVDIDMVGPVLKLSATPASVYLPPPVLGEHTDAVLRDWLDLDADTLEYLRKQNAI
jgi:crotonobetainyl-CoA:carnitine CoA-transferase CaiB-like acyl-CoA transferase